MKEEEETEEEEEQEEAEGCPEKGACVPEWQAGGSVLEEVQDRETY